MGCGRGYTFLGGHPKVSVSDGFTHCLWVKTPILPRGHTSVCCVLFMQRSSLSPKVRFPARAAVLGRVDQCYFEGVKTPLETALS